MQAFFEWCRRVWYLVNRRRFEEALRQDMDAHRAMLDRPQRFGNTLRLREEARDAWGWNWLDETARDLRLSLRMLRRSPTFTATSILILSLGIGVNLALFQIVNATLIRPLRLKDPASLVRFDRRGPNFTSNGVSYPLATFIESHNTVLSSVLVRQRVDVVWGDQATARAAAAFVSTHWFEELGATAAAGRLFGSVDGAPDARPVVVVSHDFWRRHLGARSDVVGSALRVNDRAAVVVGVAAADFPDVDFDSPAIWMPMPHVAYFVPGSRFETDWTDIEMYARLRPGVSREAAKASLAAGVSALQQLQPDHVTPGEWLEPYPGTERFMSAREAQQVWTMVLAVTMLAALVLMIACLNLSNLALARAMSRVRELGIRVGLGAGRWRVVRHLLTESCVLACLGGVGGLALGQGFTQLLRWMNSPLARLDLTPDWRTGAVMLGAALLATLAVGLPPAWKIGRSDLAHATRDGGERVSQGLQGARLRYCLVAGQIAGSCLLLVFTVQLVRSLQRALAPDLGFNFANVAVLDPALGSHGVTRDEARAYWQQVRHAVEALPETAGTALVSYAPLSGGAGSASRYRVAPRLRITVMEVEPSFFSVMRIPMLAGRLFEPRDDPRTTIIISREVALDMYGTLDVVGQRFPKGETRRVIVGVAGDAHLMNVQAIDVGEHYIPIGEDSPGASLLVRAKTDPERRAVPLRQAARAADARVLPDIRLMRDDFARTLLGPRLASAIAGVIALLALVLAALGIFGVVSHGARLRTKEVGIRLALGAQRRAIVRMLLRHTMWAGSVGLAIGLGGSLAVTRLLGRGRRPSGGANPPRRPAPGASAGVER